jgi:hypothetical protein
MVPIGAVENWNILGQSNFHIFNSPFNTERLT